MTGVAGIMVGGVVAGGVGDMVEVGVSSRRLSHPNGVALGFISLVGVTGVVGGVIAIAIDVGIDARREEDV